MTLNPRDIETTRFKKSALGRRGYDESEVDEFLARITREVAQLSASNKRMSQQLELGDEKALLSENDYLSHRVSELEQRLAMYKTALGDATALDTLSAELHAQRQENARLREDSKHDLDGVSTRAVHMLSQAQLAAEATITDAQRYARDLAEAARREYRGLRDKTPESAARGATASSPQPPGTTDIPESLPHELDRIRTFAWTSRNQMHAIVDALFGELDKLGGGARPGDPHAITSTRVDPTGVEMDAMRTQPLRIVQTDDAAAS